MHSFNRVICFKTYLIYTGGWLVVGNITIEEESLLPSLYNDHIRKPATIDQLQKATSGKLMLAPEQLRNLLSVGGYREIRARCFKPWHQRILDFVIFGDGAINPFVTKQTKFSGLCPHIRFLSDDNSVLGSADCNNIRMYNFETYWNHFAYISYSSHIILNNDGNLARFECDDEFSNTGFTRVGNWMFFVR